MAQKPKVVPSLKNKTIKRLTSTDARGRKDPDPKLRGKKIKRTTQN